MSGPFRPLVLAWGALLVLLGVEALAGRVLGLGGVTPFVGLLMAGTVAVCFMHVREGPSVVRLFAIAGVFWLAVMLVLGTMDTLTRTDFPVVMRTPVSP